VRVESCARRLLPVLFPAEPCQRYKQHPAAQNMPNSLTGLVTIDSSHPDVEEDHLRLVLLKHLESAFTVVRYSCVSTHFLNEHCRRICRVLVIVDDQNSSFEPLFIGAPLGGGDRLGRR
jgi:hypothetical protein